MRQSHGLDLQWARPFVSQEPNNFPRAHRSGSFSGQLPQFNLGFSLIRLNVAHTLFEPAFKPKFLLRNLENAIINDAIDGELAVDDPGANVFIEHLLNP